MLEKIIPDDILEKMNLSNIYKILNENIFPFLNSSEKQFVEDLEDFCINLDPQIDYEKDVYDLFPKLGANGYIQRMNPFQDFKQAGMKYEVLLGLILSICDAELDLARLASGILCANPCYHHHEGREPILKAMEEMYSGKKIGCIGITESSRGSDAVNLGTICKKIDGGDVRFSGDKVYTTNGHIADYFTCYGVYNPANPRGSMVQALIKRTDGVTTKRLGIWSVPRVFISHTFFNDLVVPNDRILGDDGQGFKNLFEGLVPERISITGSGLGISWGNLIHGMLYSQQRVQFGQVIHKYQGVSFVIADLLAKLTAGTVMALNLAQFYDVNILNVEKPSIEAEKTSASQAAMAKYLIAKLSNEISYEVMHACGGIFFTDNVRVDRTMEVSKIQEIIGGTRNVMLLLMSGSIRRSIKDLLK
jgi:alkylation response protein AidB-like acyl-CoA dehydrogenase